MRDAEDGRPRVLVLLGTALIPPFIEELGQLHSAGKAPRPWLLDLSCDLTLLDQRFLTDPPRWRLFLYRRLPIWAAQAIEAFRVRNHYDVVFAWGAEKVAMPLALLLKLARARVPFVALFNWISPRKKAWFLRVVQSQITSFILPPSSQRDFAVNRLGIPKEKMVDVPWGIDEQFWQAQADVSPDMICAVGREMRDFATLIAALDGTGITCHIAGRIVPGKNDKWRRALGGWGEKVELPANVTMGPKNPVELRELYARSRFVVLPLYESDTDNGVTCVLEAWSMGRPVVCSKTDGQRDVIDHGRNGLFVPPGDAETLRKVIVDLWDRPEEWTRMGKEGRRVVEQDRRIARFAREVSDVIVEAASSTR
jgi:glycosyltransferase involved in cell wall biosynthesis